MVKANWGLKRHCPSCGGKYYDLGKNPATCPSCRYVYDITVPLRARRGRGKASIVVDKDDPLLKTRADNKKIKSKADDEDMEMDSEAEIEEIEEVDELEVIEDLEDVDEDEDMDDDIVLDDDDVGDEILIDDVDDDMNDKPAADTKKQSVKTVAPAKLVKEAKKPEAKAAKKAPGKPAKAEKKTAGKKKR
mgnify:CR=1 FL=1